MKAPDEIYLQGYIGHDTEGVTWCEDQINDDDVRYVRADLAARRTVSGQEAQPVLWVRVRSDGSIAFDTPLWDSNIEQVRKESGSWIPLVRGDAAPIPATELSDDDLRKLAFKHCYATTDANGWIFAAELDRGLRDFARAILAAAKEKP